MFKGSVVFVILYFSSAIQCKFFLVKTEDTTKSGDDYSEDYSGRYFPQDPEKQCRCSMVCYPKQGYS